MIAEGFDEDTVMSISGHSSTRMLARYTHPTAERRAGALETFADDLLGQDLGSTEIAPTSATKTYRDS